MIAFELSTTASHEWMTEVTINPGIITIMNAFRNIFDWMFRSLQFIVILLFTSSN